MAEFYKKFVNYPPKEEPLKVNEIQPPNISQATYGLFVKQTKDMLYSNYFKNKSQQLNETKNKSKMSTTSRKEEVYENMFKNKVISQSFNNSQKQPKYNDDDLTPNKVVSIHLENEVEIRKQLYTKKHLQNFKDNYQDIITTINKILTNKTNDKGKKFFIQNKYEEILNEYS